MGQNGNCKAELKTFFKSFCTAMLCAAIISSPYWLLRLSQPSHLIIQANHVYISLENDTREILSETVPDESTLQNLCSHSDTNMAGSWVLSYAIHGQKSASLTNNIDKVATEAKSSEIYRYWTVRVHHDGNIPTSKQVSLTAKHKNLRFCDIRNIPKYGDISAVSASKWRFLPIGDKTVDVTCVRDIDSPLSQREFDAVEEWLRSDKIFHCMRDQPMNNEWKVQNGLICFLNFKNAKLTQQIFDTIQKNYDAEDGDLIDKFVWPLVRNDAMQHDSYNCKVHRESVPFPSKRKRNSSGFVGCRRPCTTFAPACPKECRPEEHQDWIFC